MGGEDGGGGGGGGAKDAGADHRDVEEVEAEGGEQVAVSSESGAEPLSSALQLLQLSPTEEDEAAGLALTATAAADQKPATPPRVKRRSLVRRSTGQGSGRRRLEVWGATSAAVAQTLAELPTGFIPLRTSLLNELGGGDLDGMSRTYEY